MVRSTLEHLKDDAFKLSKILSRFKVKLSSQQCLSVLSHLYWNRPYEAISANPPSLGESKGSSPLLESEPFRALLECGTAFCNLVQTLNRQAVTSVGWPGKAMPKGLHWDGETYLRAAGVTVERFSRVAEIYVERHEFELLRDLHFSVKAGEPICKGEVAILRIQRRESAGSSPRNGAAFDPIELRQRHGDDLLFGAEARVILSCRDYSEPGAPYQLNPDIFVTYEVAGQPALKAFAKVLQTSRVHPIWKLAGGFDIETSITLTKNDSQDIVEELWTTDTDPDGERLRKFCLKASRLSYEVTEDWPPYLRISRRLDASNTEDEFDRYFCAICAHAYCLIGRSGGTSEMFELYRDATGSDFG